MIDSRSGSIQFSTENGKSDVCGRDDTGIVCALSTGTLFTGYGSWRDAAFGDSYKWAASESYWGTMHFPVLSRADCATIQPTALLRPAQRFALP